MKIAGIYARISTDRQEEEATMESQLDALDRHAREHGYLVDGSRVYRDVFTGSRLDRPGLERLRDDVYEGKLEAILVYAPDRLARQFPYQVILLEEFRRAGVDVVFLNRTYSDRPEDQMLLQIQGVFSEYERRLIAERTRRGRIYLARQGRIVNGRAPFGYRTWKRAEGGGGLLKVYEPEAEVVREIYRWLVEEELSLKRIARRLTERAVPTREGKTGWYSPSVMRTVKNPVYKGLRYYNVLATVDTPPARPRGAQSFKDLRPGIRKTRRKRPPEEWIPVPAPALVSEEIWEKAQKQIETNRTWNPGHTAPQRYLLKSFLVCGACGRRMHGLTSTRTPSYRQYICAARYPSSRPDRCPGAFVPARIGEELVWNTVRRMLLDPKILLEKYARGHGEVSQDLIEDQEIKRLHTRLRALEREDQRLIDGYQASILTLEDLKQRRESIAAHHARMEARLKEIEAKQKERQRRLHLVEGVEVFCRNIHEALKRPNFETKVKILRLVLDRVIVQDGQLMIRHTIPLGEFRSCSDLDLLCQGLTIHDSVRLPWAASPPVPTAAPSWRYSVFRDRTWFGSSTLGRGF